MAQVSMDTIANLSPDLQRAFQISAKAERRPIELVENRKNIVAEKVKLLDDIIGRVNGIKELLPNLNTPIAIRELATRSDDEKILSGTADKSLAQPGKHSFEVSQLAKPATAVSNRFEDRDSTRVGSGYFKFTTRDGGTEEIFIDDENSTLDGIARIINQANLGLKATVVNDLSDPDEPYRLVFSGESTGTHGELEYPEFYFIDGQQDFYIETEHPAANAKLRYQDFEIESPTNEISDLIRGVTLNLKGLTDPGRPVSLSIEQDIPKTTVKIKDLVSNLNKVFSFIQDQNKLDENSDTSKTLGGDYGIRMTESRLREALRTTATLEGSSIQTVYDIGLQFNRHGLLEFDEKKFQHALDKNFDGVVALLVGNEQRDGMIPRLGRALMSVSGPGSGLLTSQKTNYASQIKRMDQDIKAREQRSERRLESLKNKLARTQAALTSLEQQSSAIKAPDSLIPTQPMG